MRLPGRARAWPSRRSSASGRAEARPALGHNSDNPTPNHDSTARHPPERSQSSLERTSLSRFAHPTAPAPARTPMDEDHTSTFPNLGNLSLNDDFLADQDYPDDQSNILDASFEYDSQAQPAEDDTDLLERSASPSPAPEHDEYAYQGSMRPAPQSNTSTAPITHNPRATPPNRPASQARVAVEEDDELSADASEEDKRRWEELRNERDRLRAVNRMLLQVSAGFDSVEGKMEVSTRRREWYRVAGG